MMGFGLLIPVLVIGLIAYLLGWRPQGSQNLFGDTLQEDSPLEILKIRYARGEISQQEFEQMREDLRY